MIYNDDCHGNEDILSENFLGLPGLYRVSLIKGLENRYLKT